MRKRLAGKKWLPILLTAAMTVGMPAAVYADGSDTAEASPVLTTASTGGQAEKSGQNAAGTSLTVTDPDGNRINAWESDGTDYLFLPEHVDLGKVQIDSTQTVVSTDAGDKALVAEDGKSVTYDFSKDKDLVLTYADNRKQTVQVMQSDTPSICINLNNGLTLDELHKDKEKKYEDNSITVTDTSDADNNVSGTVEIKGRGNSSWKSYAKKSYQIKFPKKQSVALLGMDKARAWVLIPNASDPTLVKEKVAFDTARAIGMKWVPQVRYADLWINGEYRGNYLVCDKMEIDKDRLDLSDDGVLYEFDNEFFGDEDVYFKDSRGNHFALKDPDADEANPEAMKAFENRINSIESCFKSGDWEKVKSQIDMDSLAQTYLINEYFRNDEFGSTSNFMYMDGANDTLHGGPVWDFDTCMNSFSPDGTGFYVFNNNFYQNLLKFPAFKQHVEELYKSNRQAFADAAGDIQKTAAQIRSSAAMNFTRWTEGGTDVKGHTYAATFDGNVSELVKWANERYSFFTVPLNLPIAMHGENADTVAIYRVYNPNSGEHFYTANAAERDHLAKIGWNYEGVGWKAPKTGEPIYRLYNKNAGDHHYTTNAAERDHLVSLGWKDEGVTAYSDAEKSVPVYRQYNPNAKAGAHNFTTNVAENNMLVGVGWKAEGIGWYAAG